MQNQVNIIFDDKHQLELAVTNETDASQAKAARTWFDKHWEDLGCEPLRISGKVLLLDKILGVADSFGYNKLANDESLAAEFAFHVSQALGKALVTVDIPGLSVDF